MFEILATQRARKRDYIVPAQAVTSVGGVLHIEQPSVGGLVDHVEATPTEICDADLAHKLGIDLRYLRKLRDGRIDLYDANVNGWLQGVKTRDQVVGELATIAGMEPMAVEMVADRSGAGRYQAAPPDQRTFMVRTFTGDDMFSPGVARAVLSDRFKAIDHYDTLYETLQVISELGLHVEAKGCDLSERRMVVKLTAPGITFASPRLLGNYRSPFSGLSGADLPVISAGLYLCNSETGFSRWTVGPRMEVQICTNGLTKEVDAIDMVHLGGKLDEGVVEWSDETQSVNLELIKSSLRDAVRLFLSEDYLAMTVEDMEDKAAVRLDNPGEAVKVVAEKMRYTDAITSGVLNCFIRSGDATAGGILQAITAHAQEITDPDTAWDLETSAFKALDFAATLG